MSGHEAALAGALVEALYRDGCIKPPLTDHVAHVITALNAEGQAVLVSKATAERCRAVEEAAQNLDGYHYESGRLTRNDEPGEPICGECDNDWPCPREKLRVALTAGRD